LGIGLFGRVALSGIVGSGKVGELGFFGGVVQEIGLAVWCSKGGLVVVQEEEGGLCCFVDMLDTLGLLIELTTRSGDQGSFSNKTLYAPAPEIQHYFASL
jgi:hypothetical protein